MKKYEHLIKQRDDDILKAASRNMELQTHIKRMEIEIQKWQRLAHENESMVASLNGTIQRLRETNVEDAESCCFLEEEEDEGNKTGDQETRKMMMICRCCNSRNSCVVMLPCRHLRSCKFCDAFLDSCPVCNQVKKFSIWALVQEGFLLFGLLFARYKLKYHHTLLLFAPKCW